MSIVSLTIFLSSPVLGYTRAECERDCATRADNCQRAPGSDAQACGTLRQSCFAGCVGPEQLEFLRKVGGKAGYQTATQSSVAQIVGNVIYSTLGLLGVIFLVLTVYAGFLRLTAGGEESQVEKANAYLKNGVIGLAIVLAAFGITAFVVRLLVGATLLPSGGVPASDRYDILQQNPPQ